MCMYLRACVCVSVCMFLYVRMCVYDVRVRAVRPFNSPRTISETFRRTTPYTIDAPQ